MIGWSHRILIYALLKTSIVIRHISQVEVQTQIDFWSDPVERTPVCSQTEITGSFRKFERTTVWSWSGDGLIRGHFGLKSLIIGGFERTWVWSEAISSAIGSDHKCLQTQLGLIRDHFERIIFFIFFTEGCWLCQEAAKKQLSDQRLI